MTARDFFNQMREPIKGFAIANAEANKHEGYKGVNFDIEKPDWAVDLAFLWKDTPQGYNYWLNIIEQLANDTPPQNLIDPIHLDNSRKNVDPEDLELPWIGDFYKMQDCAMTREQLSELIGEYEHALSVARENAKTNAEFNGEASAYADIVAKLKTYQK